MTPDNREFAFKDGLRFAKMHDMKNIPYFDDSDDYVFFEPRPDSKIMDSTLEGCLTYSCRIELMEDRDNLYLCEKCTEDLYGKSKFNLLI